MMYMERPSEKGLKKIKFQGVGKLILLPLFQCLCHCPLAWQKMIAGIVDNDNHFSVRSNDTGEIFQMF
jgi:hypothetical protein